MYEELLDKLTDQNRKLKDWIKKKKRKDERKLSKQHSNTFQGSLQQAMPVSKHQHSYSPFHHQQTYAPSTHNRSTGYLQSLLH